VIRVLRCRILARQNIPQQRLNAALFNVAEWFSDDQYSVPRHHRGPLSDLALP
jgi:hypothetical protein